MSVMDKFLNFMNINGGEQEDDDDYGEYDEADTEEVPAKKIFTPSKETSNDNDDNKKALPSKVTSIKHNTRRVTTGSGMELCIKRPKTFEEATEITEMLLANRAVVINLEGVDVDIAQRIIDFASGSCFAINGNLQKISRFIFIITPSSVDISGDFQELFGSAFDSPLNSGL